MQNTTSLMALSAVAAAANSGYIDTSAFKKIDIEVIYTGDGVDSAFTITFYGSVDKTNNYKLGVKPSTTGTVDTDGAVTYNATTANDLYDVVGVHPYIYIDVATVTDDIVVTVNIIGQEE